MENTRPDRAAVAETCECSAHLHCGQCRRPFRELTSALVADPRTLVDIGRVRECDECLDKRESDGLVVEREDIAA